MVELILRIANMLDYGTELEVRRILLREGHTEENVFLAVKAASVLRKARES